MPHPRRRRARIITAILALSGVALIAWENASSRPADVAATAARTAAIVPDQAYSLLGLQHTVPEIRFDGQSFADALDFMTDVSGVHMHVNWPALQAAGFTPNSSVNASGKDLSVEAALQAILNDVDGGTGSLTHWPEADGIHISTIAAERQATTAASVAPASPPRSVGDPVLRAVLGRRLDRVDFDGWQFNAVREFVGRSMGVPLVADWPSLERLDVGVGTQVTVNLRDARLADVLTAIAEALGPNGAVEWRVRDGQVVFLAPDPSARKDP